MFSLIVPTRARTSNLRRLLDSIRDTARDRSRVEVIAVIDADDPESQAFSYNELSFQRVVVPPGRTMGELNLAGYHAARGQYLMLLNDDVIVRTAGWDAEMQRVFEAFPDGIVLAHVNDLTFRDTLAIFPCVTRAFCDLAGGICRPQYRRYRIDDHIHNIFDWIHLLGYTRRIFLPQLVFEHSHTAPSAKLPYLPDAAILERDHQTFEELLPVRRSAALDCIERIEGRSSPDRRLERARFLEQFLDSIGMRRREYCVWWPGLISSPQTLVPRPRAISQIAFWLWGVAARIAAYFPRLAASRIGFPPALFDQNWYRVRYPEVAATGENPLRHYLKTGGFRGYNPGPHFDSNWYLATNPDVAASGLNPLLHYVRYGAREGRSPAPRYPDPQPSPQLVLEENLEPLSVLIPTHNRRDMLRRMLESCRRHRAGCELEFIVFDDGSTDETPALLREMAASASDLRWQSQPSAGPAQARNLAATMARHNVLLFMGDDILPSNDEFFRAHARRHAQNSDRNFAVLGKLDWPESPGFPVTFTMRRIHEDGSQFAYSRLIPGSYVGWQFFYSSNLSVKKSLVRDWTTEGFDTGFPGAALEDVELGYRLSQSPGLRLYYDPSSVGLHHHTYSLNNFLERQYRVGRSLRHMLRLHPELLEEYGLGRVDRALRRPHQDRDADIGRQAAEAIDALKEAGRLLEARNLLGTAAWHSQFLSALFELCLHDGYACAFSAAEVNLAAGRVVILDRLFSRVKELNKKLSLPDSIAMRAK